MKPSPTHSKLAMVPIVKGSEKIADGFNDFFTNIDKELKESIGNTDENPLTYIPSFIGTSLNSFAVTNVDEVRNIVENMRNVGGGHVKVNTRIFKATYLSIIEEVAHLMNVCLQTSTFPTMLKRAVVKPIYKAGDEQNFSNYRPISLLPVISKL